ncbi:MAG TPA: SH3 domain-containing protein [Allosphingosinicella sp.]|jgi:hypothetical protein
MAVSSPDFEDLLRRLGTQFDLTPTDRLRLQRTSVMLVSRGISLDSAEALPWLAPVVCRSPAEQQHFYDVFRSSVPTGAAAEDRRDGSGVPSAGTKGWEDSDEEEVKGKLTPSDWLVIFLILAGFLLYALARFLLSDPPADPVSDILIDPDLGRYQQAGESGRPPPITMGLVEIAVRIAVPLQLLAAFAIGWRILARRLRPASTGAAAPDTSMAEEAALASALPNFFAGLAFRNGLGALRRHRTVVSGRLHVGRTIRATIRTGGRPVLRFGVRPHTPEYVLLCDRESPQDHLPVIADILARRMAEEKINATHYEFYADPRRLKRISPDPDPSVKLLPDLLPSHPGARLMMLAERGQCFDRKGRPASWFEFLTGFDRPVLIDPGKAAGRPERLPLIDEADLLAVPASPAGILAYARSLSGDGDERRSVLDDAFMEDLPRVLARRPDLYLEDVAPEPAIVGALLDALEEWLGPRGIRLLRMTALHPLVDPGLTAFLGSRGSPPLLDEGLLLRLSRLPWFRTGIYPQWLRLALVKELTLDDLEFGVRHVQAYLTAPSGDLDEALARSDDARSRADFLAWLRANPGSEFHDPILVDALLGKPPGDLGEVRPGARGPVVHGLFERLLGWFWIGLAALLFLHLLVLFSLWIVRPGLELEARGRTTPEGYVGQPGNDGADPGETDPLANAVDPSGNLVSDPGPVGAPPIGSNLPSGGEPGDPASNISGNISSEPRPDPPREPVRQDPALAGTIGTVKGSVSVNVRSGPSAEASIVTKLRRGELVEVLAQAGPWWRVRLRNGTEGFVQKTFVMVATPTPVQPTPRTDLIDLPGCCGTDRTLAEVNIYGPGALDELSRAIEAAMAGLDVRGGERLEILILEQPRPGGGSSALAREAESSARRLLRRLPQDSWVVVTNAVPSNPAVAASTPVVSIRKSVEPTPMPPPPL